MESALDLELTEDGELLKERNANTDRSGKSLLKSAREGNSLLTRNSNTRSLNTKNLLNRNLSTEEGTKFFFNQESPFITLFLSIIPIVICFYNTTL